MRTLMKSAIVAFALAGAAVAIPQTPANAQASFGFYIGPDGARIAYNEGYYMDRYGYRHYYRYPRDWRRHHYPLSWYQTHPNWYQDRGWYNSAYPYTYRYDPYRNRYYP